MYQRIWLSALTGILLSAATSEPAWSAVTSVRGSASVEVTEYRSGQAGATEQDGRSYPDTGATLPLQVVARLADPNAAAAVAGAQFADPRTATGPDPDEFAIDVALSSIAADVRHTAYAKTEEVRGVRFSPGEVGAAAGRIVQLTGRMYVDGALAVFAGRSAGDLTGATVLLRVTITKEVEGQPAQQVFLGTLQASGGANRRVSIEAGGSFPRSGVIATDLAGIDPQLSVFRAYVFPNLVLDYSFEATVDQPFSLRATVEVQAANIAGEAGVAAVIGTPIESLTEVMSHTEGASVAGKMTTALQQERSAPTGQPAFASETRAPYWLLSGCGLFGVETAIWPLALVGACTVRMRVARRSRVNPKAGTGERNAVVCAAPPNTGS